MRLVAPPAGRRSGYFVVLLIVVTVLSLLGLVMVLSASAAASADANGSPWYDFRRHLIWLTIGAVAMAVTMRQRPF